MTIRRRLDILLFATVAAVVLELLQERFNSRVHLVAILALLAGMSGFIFFTRRTILGSIERLTEGTKIIATGDLNHTIEVRHEDEIGAVAEEFNKMTALLSESSILLQESEEKFRRAFVDAAIGMALVALDGRFLFVNVALCGMLGHTEDQLLSMSTIDVTFGEDLEKSCLFTCSLSAEEPISPHIEVRLVDSRGRVIWTLLSAFLMKNHDNEPLYFVMQFEDITAQKEAVQRSLETLEFNRAVLSASPIAVLTYSATGDCLSANESAARAVGAKSPEDLLRQNYRKLESWQRAGMVEVADMALLTGIETKLETRIVTTFGREAWFSCRFAPFKAGGSSNLLVLIADITEQYRLEEQLRHAQKMEAVGQLAGGIAHDFNNMLMAIIGYGSLLHMKMEKDNPLQTYVSQVLGSAEKSANLTRQLLAFSRKQIISPRLTDLNELVRSMEQLLQRLIGEDVELKTELAAEHLTAMVDPGQVEQVLMNLCTNARDAMPGGGRLMLRSGRALLDDTAAGVLELEGPGEYAVLSVSDTGMGMDGRTAQRIFEPFFTTKEAGSGTGLGLSIVYGIIKQHGGHIAVQSEVGRGSTFRIYLPLSPEGPATAEEVHPAVLRGGTETILVAEDNHEVRGLVRGMLEEFGYTVIEATDGEEAVRLFSQNRDRVRLALLDVVMPKKNGREVRDEIRSFNPDLAVLFTSGYTADVMHKRGVIESGVDFLSKPVAPEDLINKVRELLDRSPVC